MDQGGARPMGGRSRATVVAVAVLLAATAYAFPLPGVPETGRRLTAVLMVIATLWISEALPLAATALLGPALCVVFGVAPVEKAFGGFGNPLIALFIGSFLLARVTFKHHLSERIAYGALALRAVGSDPLRAFLLLGVTTAALSAWMSNTAVTAMMLPIAQAVLLAMIGGESRRATPTYGAALMLIVTYSASVGGLFTPVGTPPNLIGIGLIEQATGQRIGFGEWVVKVFPVTFACLLIMMAYLSFAFRHERLALRYDRAQMVARYAALGPWRPVEKWVAAALLSAGVLWIAPSLLSLAWPSAAAFFDNHLPEAVVPVLVTAPLFWLHRDRADDRPILELRDLAEIDWPVVLLFAGGMCLGQLMIHSGLAQALGETLAAYVPVDYRVLTVFMSCALAIAVSETASNTASANMVVPVVMAVSAQVGGDALGLGLAATVACTFGFMLPVSTAPNAMVYATGYVTQRQMIRYGVVLDCVGVVLLTLWFGLVAR
ncbi:MAG: DASS family sodium-coupled anion symporter [Candidatus Binatia bacterium]